MSEPIVVALIVLLALGFDFINGLHDAANSIATVVSTRVLSPRMAVIWAAFFNFIAFLVFHNAVAATIGKGVVQADAATIPVVAAGLVGAIAWNVITWWAGIPSSSSHALVGGFAGAAMARGGLEALKVSGIVKIGAFILIAPLLGMLIGLILMIATYWTVRRWAPARVSRVFRRLQLVSAAAYSLGHGGNDAQKTMGIILAVFAASSVSLQSAVGYDPSHASHIPMWVVLSCHAAMGLGTLMGGWRIVKTMGQKICKLQPVHGFAAESGGALCLYGATLLGIPVSTTHTITGAIVGVGSTRGLNAVKWGVATRVVWAWVLTIPAAALVAAAFWWGFDALGWK
ncbi:MAG: inorganic phosphate transporter [Planctomycetia bacterium]|nr:inorganic phosphate transporter [Planctomycetia bacterium]